MLLPLLLGQGTAGPTHYTLSVDPTSYTVTPSSVTLSVARQLGITATSYSVTPADPAIFSGKQLGITATSYAVTPSAVTFVRTYAVSVDATSYSATPANPAITAERKLPVSAGSYALAQGTADFARTYGINVDATSYNYSPSTVALDYAQSLKELLVAPFAVEVAASPVSLAVERRLDVVSDPVAATFADAALQAHRLVSVAPGSYDILATDAALSATRALAPDAGSYSLHTIYVESGYVEAGYVGGEVSADLTAQRVLKPDAAGINLVFAGVALLTGGIPVGMTPPTGGAWFKYPNNKRKSAEEIEQDRIALGILPPVVAKIVNKVAQKAIRRATVERMPDVMSWAMQEEQQVSYERMLRLEMARRNQLWDTAYSRLFEIAVQEALIAEEEAIMLLMMEL